MGADLVVQSVHKTLPAFTQTALLHLNGDLVPPARWNASSPCMRAAARPICSWRLLTAACHTSSRVPRMGIGSIGLMSRRKNCAGCASWAAAGDKSCRLGENGVFALDPSKLVISASKAGLSGPQLAEKLREAKIEPEMASREYVITLDRVLEMASREYVIAMTSLCDPEEHFRRLADALRALDHPFAAPRCADSPAAWTLPAQSMTIREAEDSEGTVLRAADALGRVCRETVFAYPPGIPLIVPGERD